MISTSNVTLRVGKKALFEDVNIKFTEGNCYGLIGANGAGKSTFLKILSGQLEPSKGEIAITPGERLSFLQQDHFKYDEYPVLDTVMMGNARLYEIMKEKEAIYAKEDFTDEDGIKASELEGEFAAMNGWEAESDAATLLNGLGIPAEMHYEIMQNLNGPEKVKVLLAQALFGNPDILLLDEPTNHMDLVGKEALETMLKAFEGTVLFVSHDRYFIKEIATGILDFADAGVDFYDCGYEEYLERKEKIRKGEIGQLGKNTANAEKNKKAAGPTLSDVFDKKTYYNPGRMESRLKGQIKKYEEQLSESETRLAELQLKQLAPELSADYEKLMEITNRIEEEERTQESLLERILETETELQELLEENSGN